MKSVIILILVIIIIIICVIIRNFIIKIKGKHHSQWSTLIPSFDYSSKKFYEELSNRMKENNIDGLKMNVITEKEGNYMSSSRLYLKVSWKEYRYYVCVAPFGNGVFFSWHLYLKQRKRELIINEIPVIGPWLLNILFPITMYRIDTANMYMTYCHEAVTDVFDEITKDTGFRLQESDRKPIIKDVFKR